MTKGYVYVLSNPSMPGLVKIGWSSQGGNWRARQLYQTGVPTPFVLHFQILVSDGPRMEKVVHSWMENRRKSNAREFFQASPDEAIAFIFEALIWVWYSQRVDLVEREPAPISEPEPQPVSEQEKLAARERARKTLAEVRSLLDEPCEVNNGTC